MSIHKIEDNQIFCLMDYETTGLAMNGVKPIEIGMIFIDKCLNILHKYESLINWWDAGDFLSEVWNDQENNAYQSHKIPKYDVINNGKHPNVIRVDIKKIIQKINKGKNKPIIISDNPFFEMFFTEVLFKCAIGATPFHYNAWSVMPLFPLFGVQMNKTHRAMEDCEELYKGFEKLVILKNINCPFNPLLGELT